MATAFRTRRIYLVLAAIALTQAMCLACINIWRYETFRTAGPFDLAFFNQQLWNSWHGMEPLTVRPPVAEHREGPEPWRIGRLRPITVVVGLIYGLWPGPHLLLLLQSCVFGVGVWPAYRLARHAGFEEWPAVAMASLYAFSPLVWLLGTNDFRYFYFGVPLLLFVQLSIVQRRPAATAFWVAVVLMCRVQLWPAVASLALGAFLQPYPWRSNFRWASAIVCGCIAWWLVSFVYVGVLFGPAMAWTNFESVRNPNAFFGKNPGQEWTLVANESTRLLMIVGPYVLLSCAAPELLLPGLVLLYPPVRMGLFTLHPAQQYVRFLTPSAAVVTVAVFVSVPRIWRVVRAARWSRMLFAACVSTAVAGQAYVVYLNVTLPSRLEHEDIAWVRRTIASVPESARVLTFHSILPNLSTRKVVYDIYLPPPDLSFEEAIANCDWALIDKRQAPLVAFLRENGWLVVEEGASVIVLRRPK